MNDIEKEIFSGLFSTPLEVVNSLGHLQYLEWDKSEDPILFNNDCVPVAILKLSNGNGAKIRFDVKPPRLSGFDFKPNRFLIDESDFISLVEASRAGQSVESYIFSELFKYPFKVARAENGEIINFIVGSFSLHNVDGVPIALMSSGNDGWSGVRFDYDPPRFCGLKTSDGKILEKAEFVELVKSSREEKMEAGVFYQQNEQEY